MRTLSIDIETYSDVDLSKCGVYKYASSPAFEVLLFGYAAGCGGAGDQPCAWQQRKHDDHSPGERGGSAPAGG